MYKPSSLLSSLWPFALSPDLEESCCFFLPSYLCPLPFLPFPQLPPAPTTAYVHWFPSVCRFVRTFEQFCETRTTSVILCAGCIGRTRNGVLLQRCSYPLCCYWFSKVGGNEGALTCDYCTYSGAAPEDAWVMGQPIHSMATSFGAVNIFGWYEFLLALSPFIPLPLASVSQDHM